MKTAYLDAFSGLSGDMMVGALIDCGVNLEDLKKSLAALDLGGYRLGESRKTLNGISATKFEVEVLDRQPERHLSEIRGLIEGADLPEGVRRRALAVFEVLAEAEAKVHRTTAEHVHFHEVGAVDSIVDVLATVWGLEQLGVGELLVSPLPMGSGFTRSLHGIIPVPAPATAELLAGFPVRFGDGAAEMVTPTGAAVIKALGRPAPFPLDFEIERIGYGAGSRELEDRPNVLRMLLGRPGSRFEADEMLEISANIDDVNPQIYDYVMERLFAAGARDVTITPTMMKKGRPSVTLTVLAEPALRDRISHVLFAETSTIGLRSHAVSRLKLHREFKQVETRWGSVSIKVSSGHGTLTVSPEYEDCRRLALEHGVPLKDVMDEARCAARKLLS